MEIRLQENTQKAIIRSYLKAFAAGNIPEMLQYIHPAIHYERYISGKAETNDNGTDSFRQFLERSAIGIDVHSLEVTHWTMDHDRVDISFRVVASEPYCSVTQTVDGEANFWFMEEMILQLVVQLDTRSAA